MKDKPFRISDQAFFVAFNVTLYPDKKVYPFLFDYYAWLMRLRDHHRGMYSERARKIAPKNGIVNPSRAESEDVCIHMFLWIDRVDREQKRKTQKKRK